ncbi:MAG: dihydroneopterin aldolase [Prevotella sp.]|nr:dihydroneopterin aldolase [Prevotella sp.]MBQ9532673.1 dihydroneopterin aldolase [Prevotella sp.]
MKLTKSYILLKGLRFRAFHGVLPQEHVTGNDYTVDLRLGCDLEPAADSDQVADTVNYAEVSRLVGEEMAHESLLIEQVAGRIAKRLFGHFEKIETIDITLTKHNPPMEADCMGAAVEMHYTRKPIIHS